MRLEQYYRANAALNRYFFTGRFNGRAVFLTIGNTGRTAIASDLELDSQHVADSIARIVKSSLERTGDPYARIANETEKWSRRGFQGAPPMTALLFVLSLAAERMHADNNFSSANYYQRLDELVGLGRGKLGQYANSTQALWKALGDWLTETDFEYGRPTAKQMNAWRHVSLAMSQAVVTLADRQLFHSMFDRFGFSGNDELTAEDMGQYIDEWMIGSKPNQRLRNAWSNSSLRTRVAEAALAELYDWAASRMGDDSEHEGPRTTRLSLSARLVPDFPSSTLFLSLGLKEELAKPIGPLSAAGLDGTAMLANTHSGSFASVSPNVATGALFKGGIRLESEVGEQAFKWSPRLVIPFHQAQSGNAWLEVTRANLIVPVMALVRDASAIVEKVDAYLSEAAFPGWVVSSPKDLSGVPNGWLLYSEISIIRSGVEAQPDVQALVPLASVAGLVAEDGLKLDRDIWHAHEPPVFKFLYENGPTRIELREGSDSDGELVMATTSLGKDCVLKLADCDVDLSGTFTVAAYSGDQPVAQALVVLRSAAKPRPRNRQGRGLLVYEALHSALPVDVASEAVSVEGHIVDGLPTTPEELPQLPVQQPVIGLPGADSEYGGDLPSPATFKHTVTAECVENGYHHWMYDMVDRGGSSDVPVARECQYCRQSTLERRWRRQRGAPARPPAKAPSRPQARQAPRINMLDEIDHDLLVDALCFMGSGSWSRLEAIALRGLDHSWQAVSLAKDLQALGLIDVQFAPGSGRPIAWSVPAPALSYISDDRAVFSGFRNGPLFKDAKRALQSVGGMIEARQLVMQPSVLTVSGIPADVAARALSDVEDGLGRKLAVVSGVPERLARAGMLGAGLKASLVPIELGASDGLEAFDLITARWREVDAANTAGAYRSNYAGRTYAVRLSDGRTFAAPFEVAKSVAAAISGRRLHEYNPASWELSSVLGAEPVGLLSRALVACSGELPTREGGVARYANIPPSIAASVLHLLYDESQLP